MYASPTSMKKNCLPFMFTKAQLAASQKHLAVILNSKLDFNDIIDNKICKCSKIIVQMIKLSITLYKVQSICKTT